jgi:aspartyl-tRNA synthetase
VEPSGELRSPIAKFLSEAEVSAILDATGAEPGSVVFLAADSEAMVNRVLGALRSHLAERFDLIDRDAWKFLYVVDFPLFKQDEETGGWAAEHHMFTAPVRVHEDLIETDPGAVLSEAYDMVLNGTEMASGSIRINRPDLQQRVFDAVGFDRADAEERFGFLLRALRYGAPPHGGIAPGLDRTVMTLAGTDNLREVIAFPKIGGGYDPLTGAPAPVPAEAIGELGLTVRAPAPGAPPPEQKG